MLVYQRVLENGPFIDGEQLGLPMNSMVIFHGYVNDICICIYIYYGIISIL